MQFYWICIPLCPGTYVFHYFFLIACKKYAGSISFLLSSKYQTCLFTGPSAFQSLCLAQVIILLVLDAYPPCLCVCKSYPSWEGYVLKPSLIMHCPVLWPFFPHICGLDRFSDSKVQGQFYMSLSPPVSLSTDQFEICLLVPALCLFHLD